MPAMLPRSLGRARALRAFALAPAAGPGQAQLTGTRLPSSRLGTLSKLPGVPGSGNYPGRTDTEQISAPCPSQQRSQAEPVPVPCQPVSLAPGLSPARLCAPGTLLLAGCKSPAAVGEQSDERQRS